MRVLAIDDRKHERVERSRLRGGHVRIQPLAKRRRVPLLGVRRLPRRVERNGVGHLIEPRQVLDEISQRGGTQRRERAGVGLTVTLVDVDRLAGDVGVEHPDPQLARERLHPILSGSRPLAAPLGDLPARKRQVDRATTDAVVRLEHPHRQIRMPEQAISGRQTRDATTNHEHVNRRAETGAARGAGPATRPLPAAPTDRGQRRRPRRPPSPTPDDGRSLRWIAARAWCRDRSVPRVRLRSSHHSPCRYPIARSSVTYSARGAALIGAADFTAGASGRAGPGRITSPHRDSELLLPEAAVVVSDERSGRPDGSRLQLLDEICPGCAATAGGPAETRPGRQAGSIRVA